jgi:NAD(P)-dependent dehydrogenase (short-subunit alcohol dehydrogenase family)
MSSAILVIGSTGLAGGHITNGLLADGYTVIGVSKSSVDNAKLIFKSDNYLHISLDISTDLDLNVVTRYLSNSVIEISGLVYACRDRNFLNGIQSSNEDWVNEFKLAVIAPYNLIQSLVLNHPLTSVVFVNSIYGLVAQRPGLYDDPSLALNPHYGCSKAAALQLVRDLAVRLAPSCKVNSLVLGGLDHKVDSVLQSKYSEHAPDKRMLDPTHIYGPVRFLLGSDSIGLTGSTVTQDGGWTAW